MIGMFQHSIDAKGRIFIPSRIREELGETFYITLSMEKCLWGFSESGWERITEKVRAMPTAKQIKMRPLFAHAAKCELDGQGRVLLTQSLRNFADLKKNVTIVGSGERVEFWDSEMWSSVDTSETTPENIADVFMELDI